MALSQASVQDQKAVQIGSAAIFYSTDSGSSFTNLGVGDSFAYTEEITPLDAEPDNGVAPERADGVASQKVTITGNLWENNLTKIKAVRGGIDLLTTVASTLVSSAAQTIASGSWNYNVPVEITGQNSSGAAPTINSITGSVDGVLVEDTDFFLQKDASTNKWSVVFIDSVTITTEAQNMVLDYDYTPAASTAVSTGGLTAASRIWIRMFNRTATVADAADAAANAGISEGDAIFDTVQYDFYYTIVNAGDSVTFPSKDDTNPVIKYALSIEGENDPTRTAGDQLFKKTKYLELQSSVTI